MRLVLSSARPCELERGHARRVPQATRTALIGYHLRCPRCGFVCTALEGDDALHIKEGRPDEPLAGERVHIKEEGPLQPPTSERIHIKEGPSDEVTFSAPIRCTYCQVLLHVNRGELRLEEDSRVRAVRYR